MGNTEKEIDQEIERLKQVKGHNKINEELRERLK